MPDTEAKDYGPRTLEALVALRAAGAFHPEEVQPGLGVWRWTFRSAGWPVVVDLDANVLSLRMVHGRDEVAMARVPARTMDVLLGARPAPAPAGGADDALAALRGVVSAWKRMNPRLFLSPPQKVGHPDNWNRA